MFRNCFFEFAGIYSGKYNLRLVYLENANKHFDSGGKYDFKYGQIPYSYEQFYYGKDYSAQPLEFEIEILNVDNYIPNEQMIEIKEWLFGQDGWQKFKLKDGRNNKSLRCILSPITDITEGNHYKGLRFSLRNASPFWYGDEKSITFTNQDQIVTKKGYKVLDVNIPDNGQVNSIIYPKIIVGLDFTQYPDIPRNKNFILQNTNAKKFEDGLIVENDSFVYKSTSVISFNPLYLNQYNLFDYECVKNPNAFDTYEIRIDNGRIVIPTGENQINQSKAESILLDNGFILNEFKLDTQSAGKRYIGTTSDCTDDVTIDTKYAFLKSKKYSDVFIPITFNPTPLFRLNVGHNICRFYDPWDFSYLNIKYIPMYRMGAF